MNRPSLLGLFLLVLLIPTPLSAQNGSGLCDGTNELADPVRTICPTGGSVGISAYMLGFGGNELINATINGPTPGDAGNLVHLGQAKGVTSGTRGSVKVYGEYSYPIALYSLPGFLKDHGLDVRVLYRSYPSDPIATELDPFGPGWRASWADRLVSPPSNGDPVTRVEWTGKARTYTLDRHEQIELDGDTYTNYYYNGQGGTRLIREYIDFDNQMTPIWFLEYPDRTRIEYEPMSQGSDLRIGRVYRGDYTNPDWSIVYTYSTDGRLTSITTPRGVALDIQWENKGSSQDPKWRVVSLDIDFPWSVSWPPEEYPYKTIFDYNGENQLDCVTSPARSIVEDIDRSGT